MPSIRMTASAASDGMSNAARRGAPEGEGVPSRSGASRVLLFAIALGLGCTGPSVSTDGGQPCNFDSDCDDGLACTVDSCGVSGLCRHDGIDERCDPGMVCETGRGCVSTASCASDDDCDDAIACTTDSCGVGGVCNHTPIDERCGDGETCDRSMGCVGPPAGECESDADCDDSVDCTRDTCAADRTCTHLALDELCDSAAGERCSATAGCFVPMPCTTHADCQDGDFCNGAEICTAEFGCAPAEAPVTCDDGDDCTLQMCDPTLPNADDPTQSGACTTPACDRSRPECGCPTTGPTCSGRFSLPGATGGCDLGLGTNPPWGFNWNFSTVQFTNTGGLIQVTDWTVNTTLPVPSMADPGPACPNIDAVAMLEAGGSGGCNETYRIQGTFTDDDTFTGTFSATFTGVCASCNMTVPVNGTRIP